MPKAMKSRDESPNDSKKAKPTAGSAKESNNAKPNAGLAEEPKAAKPKPGLSEEERSVVELHFVLERREADARRFERVGESFIDGHLIHTRARDFNSAVVELERLGCLHEVLFRCLYRWHIYEENKPKMPKAEHKDSLVASVKDVAARIKNFEEAEAVGAVPFIRTIIRKNFGCRIRTDSNDFSKKLISMLTWYADRLEANWWRPDKSLIQSSARLACILYPYIATGDYQYGLVANLLNSFENRTDDTKGKLNSVRSLKLDRENFEKSRPMLYDVLEKQLRDEHDAAKAKCEQEPKQK
jgi:hypothetical protein